MGRMEEELDILTQKRLRMVTEQIERRGISNERLLQAMQRIERHRFVAPSMAEDAYEDHPLSIGSSQTISQPYIVALMTHTLGIASGSEKVLEIGTGSGYQTAILAELYGEVYTVERHEELLKNAQKLLTDMNYTNIKFNTGDGSLGWEEYSPFDRILVTAAAPAIPLKLVDQLASEGRLVIPVGGRMLQQLKLVTKKANGEMKVIDCGGCIFVPLIGEEGWRNDG